MRRNFHKQISRGKKLKQQNTCSKKETAASLKRVLKNKAPLQIAMQ
jgi:hypothetical protein